MGEGSQLGQLVDAGVLLGDYGASGCGLPESVFFPLKQISVLLHLAEGKDKACA